MNRTKQTKPYLKQCSIRLSAPFTITPDHVSSLHPLLVYAVGYKFHLLQEMFYLMNYHVLCLCCGTEV